MDYLFWIYVAFAVGGGVAQGILLWAVWVWYVKPSIFTDKD